MKKSHVIPASLNKRLISTLMSNRKVDPNESKTFALKSSSEFASRSGDVFGRLQSLEDNHETWVTKNYTIECFEEPEEPAVLKSQSGSSEKFVTEDEFTKKKSNVLQSKIEVEHSKKNASEIPCKNLGEEPVFKKPFPVKSWKRKSSGFQKFEKQPKKWTKYSLEDVQVSSDATNAAIAFQFLNTLSSSKEKNVNAEKSDEKIVFKKPKQNCRKLAGSVKTQIPVTADISESCKETKQVLGEHKPSGGNIILAHLQDE